MSLRGFNLKFWKRLLHDPWDECVACKAPAYITDCWREGVGGNTCVVSEVFCLTCGSSSYWRMDTLNPHQVTLVG